MRERQNAMSACGIVVALGLLPLLFDGCSGRRQLEETERRGNEIIAALTAYRADHGKYPDSLADLTPEYLSVVPAPTWGLRTWKFKRFDDEFELRVDESSRTGDGSHLWFKYLGEKGGWQTGD